MSSNIHANKHEYTHDIHSTYTHSTHTVYQKIGYIRCDVCCWWCRWWWCWWWEATFNHSFLKTFSVLFCFLHSGVRRGFLLQHSLIHCSPSTNSLHRKCKRILWSQNYTLRTDLSLWCWLGFLVCFLNSNMKSFLFFSTLLFAVNLSLLFRVWMLKRFHLILLKQTVFDGVFIPCFFSFIHTHIQARFKIGTNI